MSDGLKDGAVVVLGLALFSGLLNHRAEHAIVHDISQSTRGGQLRADVEPRGVFGLLLGQAKSVTVTGHDFAADGFPFRLQRGAGIRAYTRTLDFAFTDITLRGVAIERFTASIPNVSLDAGRALFDERIILRTAGQGTASATVDAASIERFAAKRYKELKNVTVVLRPAAVQVSGDISLFGVTSHIEASGGLAIRDSRYVSLTDGRILVNGTPLNAEAARSMLRTIDPLLDLDRDVGLGTVFHATGIDVGDGKVTIHGSLTVPRAASPAELIP